MSPDSHGTQAKGICIGILRLASTEIWVLATGFLHSLHSPFSLTKDAHSPLQTPSMVLGHSVPNPVRYLTHYHPCSHLQPTLEQHHLSNKFHFPTCPVCRTAKIQPVTAIRDRVCSVHGDGCGYPPAPSSLPVKWLDGLPVVIRGNRIADRWY